MRCEYPRAFFGQDMTAAFGVLRGVGRQMVCCTSMMQTFSLLRTMMLYFLPHLSSERDCLSMGTYWPRSFVRSPNGGTQLGVALHSAAAVCHLVRGTVATMLVLFNVLRGVCWHLEGSASRIQTFHSYGS